MKYIILFSIACLLSNSSLKSQNNECIGDSINISLQDYKLGSIQWQFSNDKENWVDIENETKDKLSYILIESGFFRAKVTYGNCIYFADTLNIDASPQPTLAKIGLDKNVISPSTTLVLNANEPINGTGHWSIKSGIDGSFSDSTKSNTTFSGKVDVSYVLIWTISTACKSSSDDINVTFYDPSKKVIDSDGNFYNVVSIGTQVWMAENLKTTKYANGDIIGTTIPSTLDVSGEDTPKYQWAYNGDENNVDEYGRIYTWDAVNDDRNICPEGWHVPSDTEWTTLELQLGTSLPDTGYVQIGWRGTDQGTQLKSTSGWGNDGNGTNTSGFSAHPGGIRYIWGGFRYYITNGVWWSSSKANSNYAWTRGLSNTETRVDRSNTIGGKICSVSVRCLRD
jgi:uncharacterized protein (TIGR02145 family)